MNIVTTTSVFPMNYPPEDALVRLSALGFKHLDFAMDYTADNINCPFSGDDWEPWAYSLRELADKNGVEFSHSHAWGDASSRHYKTFRCFDICKVLGTKYTVIHPIYKHEDGSFIQDDEEFVRVNSAAIKPLLEYAEKTGVTILSENLLWGSSIRATAISALVKEVGSSNFAWCYDTGHANAHALSCRELLKCDISPVSLHIQDNNGHYRDDHLMPGDGNIDWKEFLDVLHKVGYQGEFVLEAHHQSLEADDKDRDGILSEIYSRAVRMRDYFLGIK